MTLKGLVQEPKAPSYTFAQPCVAHRGDRCGIYADRPQGCTYYSCDLLRGYEAGEIGRAEALARIAEAHAIVTALRARIEALRAPASLAPLGDAIDAALEASEPGGAAHDRRVAAAAEAAAVFLRHHFDRRAWPHPGRG